MLNSYRRNDPVIYICQNNDTRTIEISALNDSAESVSGYGSSDLMGKPLSHILPARVNDAIDDIVEFEPGARDISDALLKCRDFGIRNKNGAEVPFKARIVRCAPTDKNEWFQIVLVGEENQRRTDDFQRILAENFKGHETLDERTGLPDRKSLIKDLELSTYHAKDKKLPACLAIIEIDRFAQCRQDFGDEIAFNLYRHVAAVCRRTLRDDDTLSMVNSSALGSILMNTNRESGRMAINRLRWTIAANPMVLPSGMQMPVTVSIVYAEIGEFSGESDILTSCEQKMSNMRVDPFMTNAMRFVLDPDRRTGRDRRKANMPVTVERRHGQRRNK